MLTTVYFRTLGTPGTPGTSGKNGINGDKGIMGARGPVGPQGERGLPGPRGRAGNVRIQYLLRIPIEDELLTIYTYINRVTERCAMLLLL